MTTQRLYFDDAYLTHFQARVVKRLEWDGHPAVILDRTAFYPEGGGQPADQGTLNGIPVLDVQAQDDGSIVHVLERPLSEDTVEGRVNWDRRYDHMQQHTGQHILSQAFLRVAEAETIGFHLGATTTTIDLDRGDLTPDEIARAEELANRVIEENREVSARFVERLDLERVTIRRPPKVNGPIRLVEIADFDVVPCGGTHVRRTGEVGLLAIVRTERYKGGWRITFVAGRRARADYRRRRELLAQLGEVLTCGDDDLIPRVERLLAEQRQLSSALRKAQERLLSVDAEALWNAASSLGDVRLIRAVFDDRDVELVRKLAGMLREQGPALILLGWRGEGKGRFVFAATPGLNVHMGNILRAALAEVGGRGGGRPEWAEGGVPDPARVADVLDQAQRAILNTWSDTA